MQERNQQLILADKQKSAENQDNQDGAEEKLLKSAEAEDDQNQDEQEEEKDAAANDLDESGLKAEEMEGIDESKVNCRRQETVSFQLDENEVSFNKYRAIIEDREERCKLQTQIDQEVKELQQKL